MKTFPILCVTAMVTIVFAVPASAEFYKYKDETGAIRFTDDISRIPEDQRPKVKQYYDAPPSQSTGAENDQSSQPETRPAEEETGEGPLAGVEQKRKALDAEFDQLNVELNELREMRADMETKKQKVEYEKRAKAYNQKIAEYEKKRVALEAEEARIRAEIAAKEAEKKAEALAESEKNSKSAE